MWFRITRLPEVLQIAGVKRKTKRDEDDLEELVGYLEADSYRDARQEAAETYGDVRVRPIAGDPDDDVWPEGSEVWTTDESREEEGQEFYLAMMDVRDRNEE